MKHTFDLIREVLREYEAEHGKAALVAELALAVFGVPFVWVSTFAVLFMLGGQ